VGARSGIGGDLRKLQSFNVARPTANRSLQGQDRFAIALKQSGEGQAHRAARAARAVGAFLRHCGDSSEGSGDREYRGWPALGRHGGTAYKVLTELLHVWPDDASDPMRSVVRRGVIREILGDLNEPHEPT